MIYVFNQEEEFEALLSNQNPDACPFWDADLEETLQGEFTFTFTVPAFHEVAKKLQEKWYVATKDPEGLWQLFIIQEIEDEHNEQATKTIFCEHAITELLDEIVEDQFIDRKLSSTAVDVVLTGTRWKLGEVSEDDNRHTYTIRFKNVLEALEVIFGRWGREARFRVVIAGNRIQGRFIDLYVKRGTDTGKRFDFENDLKEIVRTVDVRDIKTALWGRGARLETETTEPTEGEEDVNDTSPEETDPDQEPARVDFTDVEWSTEPVVTNLLTKNQANRQDLPSDGIRYEPTTGRTAGSSTAYVVVEPRSHWIRNDLETDQDIHVFTDAELTAVEEGKTYTASGYAQHSGSDRTSQTIYMGVHYHGEDGTTVRQETWTNVTTDTEFKQLTQTFTVDEATKFVSLEFRISSSAPQTSLRIDALQIEQNDTATSFLEGGETRTWGGKPVNKPAGQGWIYDEDAREKWGRTEEDGSKRHLKGVAVFDQITDPEELLLATWQQLQEQKNPRVSYKANAVDLFRITGERFHEIRIGDTVKILDHDLDIKVQARVLARKLDINFPELIEWTFGNIRPLLTNAFEQLKSDLAREVRNSIGGDFLERGEQIKTDWLEGEIDVLRNQVLAGGGTVTLTEGDGILVTDKPPEGHENYDPNNPPTKALRLIGGVLAIANSKVQGSNQWNWKAFGTGDGFTAELITTGTMMFDRAKGGLLKLGGDENGNGVMEVYDSQDQLVSELSGDRRGFDRLNIIHLESENALLKNVEGNFTIYVNHVWGVDDLEARDGRTSETAFQTIQFALDNLPKFNEFTISISVDNNGGYGRTFDEDFVIKSFTGGGTLNIYLGEKNRMNGMFDVHSCTNRINVQTHPDMRSDTQSRKAWITNINRTGMTGIVAIEKSQEVDLEYLVLIGQNLCRYGVDSRRAGYTRTLNLEIYDVEHSSICSAYGTTTFVQNCVGWSARGLYGYGGYFLGSGTAPAGSISDVTLGAGGQSFFTFNHQAGSNPNAPEVVRRTTTWTNNDTHSVWAGSSATYWTSGYAYNGKRPSDPPNWYGIFYFNNRDFGTLKNADGSPRKIISVRLKARRTNNTGENTSRQPRVHWSNKTTASGSVPSVNGSTRSNVGFKWGEEKWITLPVSFGEAFRDGTAKSIVFYDAGLETHYSKYEFGATLEIVHE